jgi:hypothetical protein
MELILMLVFDKAQMEQLFRERLRYKSKTLLERDIDCLGRMDEKLQPVLDAWVKDGTIVDFQIGEVSLSFLMEDRSFFDALLDLEVLIKKPNLAKKRNMEIRW